VLLRALIAVRVPEAVHGRAFAAYNAARSTAELGALGAGGGIDRTEEPRRAAGLLSAAARRLPQRRKTNASSSTRVPVELAFLVPSGRTVTWRSPAAMPDATNTTCAAFGVAE
jgi:hypothetical protein